MAEEYTARETELKIAKASDITITTSDGLETFFASAGSSISVVAKNVTLTPPDMEVDKEDFLGETDDFQNQAFHEKPVSEAKLTCTVKFTHDSPFFEFLSGTGTDINSGAYTRYQIGASTTGKKRVDVSALITLSNADGDMNFVLDNAKLIKHGDMKLGGGDGYWEQDIEIVALAKDYYEEVKA